LTSFIYIQAEDITPNQVRRTRRVAAKIGCHVYKARGVVHYNQRGGLMLTNADHNVIGGVDFDMRAQDVINHCIGVKPVHYGTLYQDHPPYGNGDHP
jgi:hypothetical protein